MSWGFELFLVGIILLVLLAIGQRIAFALGLTGMLFILFEGGVDALRPLGYVIWNSCNNFNLTAIPLFLLMGEFILQSGISERFYQSLAVWFNRIPGGLLHSNILGSAVFAAMTGVSIASAAALGTVAIPSQKQQGYDQKMIFGSLSAGGTLSIIIPPSIPLIIYGALTENSIVKLFISGIIPGVILAALFSLYIGIRVFVRPELAPRRIVAFSRRDKITGLKNVLPVGVIGVIVLLGIYLGWMTPTEAGGVGALCAFLLCLFFSGTSKATNLRQAFRNSVRTTCMLLSIMVGAQVLAFSLVDSGINREITEWAIALNLPKFWFFALVYMIYIILGFFLDPISIMFLTLPIFYPIIVALGVSPVWFGIVLAMLIEIGLLTPPVGMNLFIIHGVSGGAEFKEVVLGTIPFVIIVLAFLVALTALKLF